MLAIAGLVLAGIYIALLVFVAAVGFFRAIPFFLPDWTLALAAAAAGLSFLALRQIRESEGTRAGQSLARWGLALSIFAGLGYTAYKEFTGLALVQQANNFLMVRADADAGFFPRLQSGAAAEINHAFLLTVPESSRGSIDPKDNVRMKRVFDGGKGPEGGALSRFRNHFLVRSLARHGKDASIEPLGVQNWAFGKAGYVVLRQYRVTMPEMTIDLLMPVHSTEGDQRKWFLAFPLMDLKKSELTPLGIALMKASFSAREFVDRSAAQTPWHEFTDKTLWDTVVDDEPWRPLRDQIVKHFRKGGESRHKLESPPPKSADRGIPPWDVVNQRLRFTLDLQYKFQGRLDAPGMGDGLIVVENQRPVALDSHGLPDLQTFAQEPDWKIVSIEFQRLTSMEKMMERKMAMPR